mmetsp:Transcript_6767/g.6929  ORF Transcript_6767/g.6929 Transcript_6767/m.6929 type:complete len:203 (+) Transcript_6767:1438-2046(+)
MVRCSFRWGSVSVGAYVDHVHTAPTPSSSPPNCGATAFKHSNNVTNTSNANGWAKLRSYNRLNTCCANRSTRSTFSVGRPGVPYAFSNCFLACPSSTRISWVSGRCWRVISADRAGPAAVRRVDTHPSNFWERASSASYVTVSPFSRTGGFGAAAAAAAARGRRWNASYTNSCSLRNPIPGRGRNGSGSAAGYFPAPSAAAS